MQLHAEVQHTPFDFSGLQFGFGSHVDCQAPFVVLSDAVVNKGLYDVYFGIHFGHFELGVLHVGQGLAEHLAFHDKVPGKVKGAPGIGCRPCPGDKSLLRQALHEVEETVSNFAKNILFGNFDVVKEQLGSILGFEAHFVEVSAPFEPFHSPLHNAQCHGMGIVLGV